MAGRYSSGSHGLCSVRRCASWITAKGTHIWDVDGNEYLDFTQAS